MPKGGNWTPLKNEATDFVQGTGSANITPASLLTNFIRAAGGLAGLMRGHGGAAPSGSGATRTSAGTKGATGGGAAAGTSAAVGTARNLGGFLSSVADVGLEKTLSDRGLESVVGKSASDVKDYGIDVCANELTVESDRESADDLRALASSLRRFTNDGEIRKAITSVAVVQPINDYVGLVRRGLTEARNWITDKGSAKLCKAAGIGSSKDA
jgi:hypothetical protein